MVSANGLFHALLVRPRGGSARYSRSHGRLVRRSLGKYQKDHALCSPHPRTVAFNHLFAGISISTTAAGEFSNSPPAGGTGASAFIGGTGPDPRPGAGRRRSAKATAHLAFGI